MKKISLPQRQRDVTQALLARTGRTLKKKRNAARKQKGQYIGCPKVVIDAHRFIDSKISQGLRIKIHSKENVEIILPEIMDLSDNYETTMEYLHVIRKLCKLAKHRYRIFKKAYRLWRVNFDEIQRISSSAALLLTAELSRWDDQILNKLKPITSGWKSDILQRFLELGFFDLFKNKGDLPDLSLQNTPEVRFVKYIKGNSQEKDYSQLKKKLNELVGAEIQKWTFLHSGLDEAITNVMHHAYPDGCNVPKKDQNWYLTGAYNGKDRTLKIVFFDQGVGIPKTLPASKIWEKVLEIFSGSQSIERMKDAVLLKAAVEVSRTSTGQPDRGKGLADMLQFILQRNEGHLSILSGHGLYKFSIENGSQIEKTHRFACPTMGTLIIWKVQL